MSESKRFRRRYNLPDGGKHPCFMPPAGSHGGAADTSVRLAASQMGREGIKTYLQQHYPQFAQPTVRTIYQRGHWNFHSVTGVAYCPGADTNPPSFRVCVGVPTGNRRAFPNALTGKPEITLCGTFGGRYPLCRGENPCFMPPAGRHGGAAEISVRLAAVC